MAQADRAHDVPLLRRLHAHRTRRANYYWSAVHKTANHDRRLSTGSSSWMGNPQARRPWIVAQSYLSISDCANAKIWARKAKDASPKGRTGARRGFGVGSPLLPCPAVTNRESSWILHRGRASDQLLNKTGGREGRHGWSVCQAGRLYYGVWRI